MRYRQSVKAALCFFIIFAASTLYGQTTIELTPVVSIADIESVESGYEEFPNLLFDENKEIIPTALAIVNTLGYPNGRATIRQFPHLEFGAAAGGGILEFSRKDDYTDDKPTFPFGAVNGGFHIGTGIIDTVDVTFKVFIFSFEDVADDTKDFEGEGNNTSYKMEIADAELNSYGVKFRYNFVKRRVIYPLTFAFGGMSLNLAFDYISGNMESTFRTADIQRIDYNNNGTASQLKLDVAGVPEIDFDIYTITPEAYIYFDLFMFLSFYTGPSVSFNFGEFNFNLDAEGTLVDEGNNDELLATAELHSEYKMEPRLFIPRWTAGFEISILALKLQVEGSTILTSASDSFTGQVGARFQF